MKKISLSSPCAITETAGKSEAERAAEKAARDAKSAREKDAREAAAATRELEQSLQGLRRAYDPVATAQEKYKEQLAEITALENERAGKLKISADEATRFRNAAKAELTDALSADLNKLADQYDLLGGSARKYRDVLAEIAALGARCSMSACACLIRPTISMFAAIRPLGLLNLCNHTTKAMQPLLTCWCSGQAQSMRRSRH